MIYDLQTNTVTKHETEYSIKAGVKLVAALNWRYATQSFDSTRKIPDATWETLEESLRLAPSAFGLQPWKFIVVTDQHIKESLVEHSYGQSKIADASHLLVIAARTRYTPDDTARFIARNAQVRGVEATSLDGLASMINGTIAGRTLEQTAEWLKRQAYIPLGFFLTAAALIGVDAGPMEGFSPEGYDEVLGLKGSDYSATVVAAAGYRAPNDKYAHLPKVRYAPEDVFLHI